MGEDALARLEVDYCPPLDPALLSAIVSDYDLENDEAAARETLDQLKESALLEEAAGFDPSGTGAQADDTDGRAESCSETNGQTDLTSISNGMSSLELDGEGATEYTGIGNAEDLEHLDDETKIRLLEDVFGDRISKYTVQHTLKKCGGRWQATMEELLNHVYFDEAEHSDGSGVPAKGVDAFSEDNVARRGRKGKTKNKRFKTLDERRSSSLPSSPASPVVSANRWQTAAQDVEFIASRTRIATATVSSIYYEQGASTPKTIGALLKASMEESKHIVTDDALVSSNARDLGFDFPSVDPSYLAAIVRLTHPDMSAAHELATALTTRPKDAGGIQLIPQYAQLLPSDLETTRQAKPRRAYASADSSDAEDSVAASRVNAYASARATAFSQASAAHRKAKSNRLMGGAAAYYGQVGREFSALSFQASAAAADQLANSQSSSTQLDLHGIDVLNGVRIAEQRAEDWWDRLGESRVNGRVGADDRQNGYRIVVGAGTHSAGGKGKLGPAVSKALRESGWKIENAGAVIVVKGKVRR